MNREEAMNILDDFDVNFEGHTAEEVSEAFDMAFKALEKENIYDDGEHYVTISKALYDKLNIDYEQALSQEPCDDVVSRERALEPYKDLNNDDVISVWMIKKNINELPSVTQKTIECDDAISRDFQIGDEVRIIGSDPIYDDCDVGWVIRNASKKVKTMYVMRNDGSADEEIKAEWYKTGRHNAMLAEVIKALPSVTQKSVIEGIKTEIKTEMEEHRDIDDFSKGVGYGLRSAIGIIERRAYDL